jgi:hypothetical protein
MQDSATAHTTNNSMNALAEAFGGKVISERLWLVQTERKYLTGNFP